MPPPISFSHPSPELPVCRCALSPVPGLPFACRSGRCVNVPAAAQSGVRGSTTDGAASACLDLPLRRKAQRRARPRTARWLATCRLRRLRRLHRRHQIRNCNSLRHHLGFGCLCHLRHHLCSSSHIFPSTNIPVNLPGLSLRDLLKPRLALEMELSLTSCSTDSRPITLGQLPPVRQPHHSTRCHRTSRLLGRRCLPTCR